MATGVQQTIQFCSLDTNADGKCRKPILGRGPRCARVPLTSTSVTTVYLRPQPPCSRRLTTWRGDRGGSELPPPSDMQFITGKVISSFQTTGTNSAVALDSCRPILVLCVPSEEETSSRVWTWAEKVRGGAEITSSRGRGAELGHTQSWSHDQVAARPWELSRGAVSCLGDEPTAIMILHGHKAKQGASGGSPSS